MNRDDQGIDEIYRRGLADMASSALTPAREERRRRRLLRALVAAAWLAAISLGAYVAIANHSDPSHGSGVAAPSAAATKGVVPAVPWAALTPPAATPALQPLAACRAVDVTASPLTSGGFAAGSEGFSGVISLRGAVACYLPGNASAAILDSRGNTIAHTSAGAQAAPAVLTAGSNTARVSLLVGHWCAAPVGASAMLRLVSGDVVRLPIQVNTPTQVSCSGSATYTLSITGSMPPIPLSVGALTAAFGPLGPLTPGQRFGYTVALTNPGTATVAFAPCPVYDEGIKVSPSLAGGSYQLNCQAATSISPGGTEVFQMYINIPSSVPAGQFQLTWDIEGTTVAARAQVSVS